MKPKRLAILGSTGSIGKSTLDVVRLHPDAFEVKALAAYSNVDLLATQCREFKPAIVCLVDESRTDDLAAQLQGTGIELVVGSEAVVALAERGGVDVVVNAVVGAAGLRASLAAVKADKYLALANKESLVTGGPLFADLMKRKGARILPVDSEHSAIWQALMAGRASEIRRVIITASGGPFRTLPAEQFAGITPEKALNHPTWNMGPKITVDSSTLANKGLEVIEAVSLFGVPVDQVEVVVHPQSIVHSMVEFQDSSIIAQLSRPDMRLPITYALFWPERAPSDFGRLDFAKRLQLDFEPPDLERFPALRIAFDVARAGGTAPALFNAANEVAVEMFLSKKIAYTDIAKTIENVVNRISVVDNPNLEDILNADRQARELAAELQEN
ncbi:MAG TPA: 1-deoxy-D-xylulose-5-phosphate reductoisomerase [candidate division Zixibacteria bacterium]|nr:1-deoxy-D-xylulose-5-phosphate reductoisomerase [candidate division Zixibacteria bacterium]